MEPDPGNAGGGMWVMSKTIDKAEFVPRAVGVHVQKLRLAWATDVLVEELSFEASENSWTCLLGESGVGKTTLLRTIAGLLPPISESMIKSSDGSPLDGKIAYMAQQDLLLPWLTALENVGLGAHLRGNPLELDKATSLLEWTGISSRKNALPKELSGGERQRVALARTLMEARPIVLMDEPFSFLDAITRNELQELAFELLKTRTVIMVTHDPFEALRLAKRIHILRPRSNENCRAITPPGLPLRDPTDPSLRDPYKEIMSALSEPEITTKL